MCILKCVWFWAIHIKLTSRGWTVRNWRRLKKQIQDLVGLPDWRAGAVWNQDTSWLSAFLWQYKSEFIFWGNSLPPLVCPHLTFALLSTLVWSSALFRFHSLISSFFTPVFWSVLFFLSPLVFSFSYSFSILSFFTSHPPHICSFFLTYLPPPLCTIVLIFLLLCSRGWR